MHWGCFVWTPTPPLAGWRTPRPGPVRGACACPSWPGRAGRPPGRVLVRLTFSFVRFFFPLCWAPSRLGLPLFSSFVCPHLPPFAFVLLFFSFSFVRSFLPCAPSVSCFSWFPAPGALGLGALRCLFCWPRASWLSVRSRFLGVAWPWAALRWLPRPPPPLLPLLLLLQFLVALFFFVFLRSLFLLSSLPPLSQAFCVFWPRVPWALALICVGPTQ